MRLLMKAGGVYLIVVAMGVAFFFAANPLVARYTTIDVLGIWQGLNILVAVAVPLALNYNYVRKRRVGGRAPGERVYRRYLEANVAFYGTVAVTLLFLNNWFSLLIYGPENLGAPAPGGNHQAWVIWAAVNVLLPIVLGTTGYSLWGDAEQPMNARTAGNDM